jgi:hypothetical protein
MTTYRPLDCDGFAAALADHLEGDAPVAMRAAVEAHAARCADCGRLLEDIGSIREEAAALPALAPSRDLWAGIAERIDAKVLPLERPAQRTSVVRRWWARPAVAAAALVLATAGITHLLTRMRYEAPVPAVGVADTRVAVTPAPVSPAPDSDAARAASARSSTPDGARGSSGRAASAPRLASAPQASGPSTPAAPAARLASAVPVMRETEPVFDDEIAKLHRILASRRSQLDPKTVAVLEQSVAVIDSAIAQSRAALARDPASGFLATQLNHSLEKKVELLRTAALLPART